MYTLNITRVILLSCMLTSCVLAGDKMEEGPQKSYRIKKIPQEPVHSFTVDGAGVYINFCWSDPKSTSLERLQRMLDPLEISELQKEYILQNACISSSFIAIRHLPLELYRAVWSCIDPKKCVIQNKYFSSALNVLPSIISGNCFERLEKLEIQDENLKSVEPLAWIDAPNLSKVKIQGPILSLKSMYKIGSPNICEMKIENAKLEHPAQFKPLSRLAMKSPTINLSIHYAPNTRKSYLADEALVKCQSATYFFRSIEHSSQETGNYFWNFLVARKIGSKLAEQHRYASAPELERFRERLDSLSPEERDEFIRNIVESGPLLFQIFLDYLEEARRGEGEEYRP